MHTLKQALAHPQLLGATKNKEGGWGSHGDLRDNGSVAWLNEKVPLL